MTTVQFRNVDVGDTLPALLMPAVSRTTLALYCGASGDHNPIHVDIDYARNAGLPDVFAHGMLSAAYLGRLLTQWVPQKQIRSFSARFTGITQIGDRPACTGVVVEKFSVEGEQRVRLLLRCTNQNGEEKVLGDAVVALEDH